jgi:hypothetical protein
LVMPLPVLVQGKVVVQPQVLAQVIPRREVEVAHATGSRAQTTNYS